MENPESAFQKCKTIALEQISQLDSIFYEAMSNAMEIDNDAAEHFAIIHPNKREINFYIIEETDAIFNKNPIPFLYEQAEKLMLVLEDLQLERFDIDTRRHNLDYRIELPGCHIYFVSYYTNPEYYPAVFGESGTHNKLQEIENGWFLEMRLRPM